MEDLGAQAVSKALGNLPVVDPTESPGKVRVVWSADYLGPGSGLDVRDLVNRRRGVNRRGPTRRSRRARPTVFGKPVTVLPIGVHRLRDIRAGA
jgi:hypothetical protein